VIFTKKGVGPQNLRIVPPFAIGSMTFAYGIVFLLVFPNPYQSNAVETTKFLFGFLGVFFLLVLARGEDRIAVAILGRTAESEGLYFEKLRVHADIDEVKTKLQTPEVLD